MIVGTRTMALQYAMGQDAYHSGERFHDDFCDEWKSGYNDERNANMTQWGPEIAVNGVRPEWLRDDDDLLKQHHVPFAPYLDGEWQPLAAHQVGWETAGAIRLPADHPYYGKDDVPDWAKVKAFRLGYPDDEISDAAVLVNYDASSVAVKELARYIAKHEPPPLDEVDRFLSEHKTRDMTQGMLLRAFLAWQREQG